MAKLHFDIQGTEVDVSVDESDIYTNLVRVRYDNRLSADSTPTHQELFLTPEQLETLGYFLTNEANKIHAMQVMRNSNK